MPPKSVQKILYGTVVHLSIRIFYPFTDYSRKPRKGGNVQSFAPHHLVEAAISDDFGQFGFGKIACKQGGKSVYESFAPLPERRSDDLEKKSLFIRRDG